MTRSRALLAGYLLAGATDAAALALGRQRLRWLTKPVLMPLLAGWVAASAPPGPASRGIRRALLASAAGDTALLDRHRAALPVGMGCFLAAHAQWIAAFDRCPPPAGSGRPPAWLPIPYLAAWVGANATIGRRAGALRAPMGVYSLGLAGLAVRAARHGGPGSRGALGAHLFLASDTLLAAGTFQTLPARRTREVAVMASYLGAQYLLASYLVEQRGSEPRVTGAV